QRHRRELQAVGHVAHRIDAGHVGLVVGVDDHLALAALGHAHGFQPEVLHVRNAAGGVEHGVGHDDAATFAFHPQSVVGLADVDHVGIQAKIHAVFDHFSGHKMPDLVVEAAQDLFASVELGHLCAQAGEDGSELAGDITAAHHQQATRERLDIKDV